MCNDIRDIYINIKKLKWAVGRNEINPRWFNTLRGSCVLYVELMPSINRAENDYFLTNF